MANSREWIERPLATCDNIVLQLDCQFVYENVKREWDYLPMFRLWSIGYCRPLLVDWFASFPPELVHAFRKSLAVVQKNMIDRISYLHSFESLRTATVVECEAISTEFDCSFDGTLDDITSCAFMSLRFDPKTQIRQRVWANSMQAGISGIHREELLARFANHDLTFGMSDIEFLCLCIDDLLNGMADRAERFYRQIFVCSNGAVRAVLLHGSRARTYNSVGQLVQVIFAAPLHARSRAG